MTGLKDYWRMFRVRGFGRVWHHFLDVTLFDIVHRTDTDTWLPIKAYVQSPGNIASAVHYQPSFTSEIRRSLKFVEKALGEKSRAYDFYDLGSGKGKVCFIARDFDFRSVHGIEFYKPLNDTAIANAARFPEPRAQFHCVDVTAYDFASDCLVFFAYNPFGPDIWRRLLENLKDCKYVVIYNNPVHEDIFQGHEIWHTDTQSRWENKRNVIFASFPKP